MNFLILINGAPKYKYFFAEIAHMLEKKGHKVFFAVNSRKSSIVEPLEYIDGNKNTFIFDDYMFEKSKMLMSENWDSNESWGDVFFSDFDRFFSHNYNLDKDKEYWKKIFVGLKKFFHEIILNQKINCILYENVSNSFAYMAYMVGEQLKCTYIGLMTSRLPKRYEIQSSIYDESKYIEEYKKESILEFEEKICSDYLNSLMEIQPDYMKNNILNKKITLFSLFHYRKIKTFSTLLRAYKGFDGYFDYQSGNSFHHSVAMFKYNFIKYVNERSYKYYILVDEVDKLISSGKEKFFIYPTHYHPESSTSVLAPDYTNEFNNIVNIHNNLPVGTYLYVKDHISARGIQCEDFYQKLSALPGVRIIDFNYNVKKLIKSSLGVITVTSTVGYEAALMGKPVYLFGRFFYENFHNVYKLQSFRQLRSLIGKHNDDFSREDIIRSVVAYYRYTFEGELLIGKNEQWSEDYFSKLTDNILKKVGEKEK